MFDSFSLLIYLELMDFKTRRINHFKKNLVDLAELELKHARVSISSVVYFGRLFLVFFVEFFQGSDIGRKHSSRRVKDCMML